MRVLDLFCGEGGAALGYANQGLEVFGVDSDHRRLKFYPFGSFHGNALEYLSEHGKDFDFIHASPPCTGYSIATSALPDRLDRYDRLIPVVRDLLEETGKPYVIENVYNARKEMKNPQMLCGRMFGLETVDDDGVRLVLDRHRMFETNWGFVAPAHLKHDKSVQVAGSYGGARRDKVEARKIRKGGYVPSLHRQKELLGVTHMTQKGMWLSIPPAYTEFIAKQFLVDNA